MFDPTKIREQQMDRADCLARDASLVYSTLVLPTWGGPWDGFPEPLYGVMMAVFARFDILSSYWRGEASSRGQSVRMIQFLDTFRALDTEANSVAVHMGRHKLIHTSQPRYLINQQPGKVYRWLLHWHEHLPREQHFRLADMGESKQLDLGLIYLLEDLGSATKAYLTELEWSPELRQNYERVEDEINLYKVQIEGGADLEAG